MTLAEMRAWWPERFYRQDWFYNAIDGADEAFMHKRARDADLPPVTNVLGVVPTLDEPLPYSAADLANIWLHDPTLPMWDRYLWTNDFDHLGQRIYVGQNGHGFEIHRHLHLTERWGVPC